MAFCVSTGIKIDLDWSLDVIEAQSLGFHHQYIDIYSSSWGPFDDGMYVEGPGSLVQATLKAGVSEVWSFFIVVSVFSNYIFPPICSGIIIFGKSIYLIS